MSILANLPPATKELLRTALLTEKRRRLTLDEERRAQQGPGGLLRFIRYFWHVLEPKTPFVEGWPLASLCEHLEAVTAGEITRLLATVPPGFMKSLATDVFWPAWEWGPMDMAHLRYVAFSYAASLTERDNGKFRDLLMSPEYKELWGDRVILRKVGETKVTNTKHGSKLATSVGGVGTGERGNRVILDDAHNIKEIESDLVRQETVRWVMEAMSNRLNDMERDAIVVIMQRSHEADVAGALLDAELGYCHFCIPMEYDPARAIPNDFGWVDPREEAGELAWPGRYPEHIVESLKRTLGKYAYSGQYQQIPTPAGGGIFKRDWWQLYPPDGEAFNPTTGKPLKPLEFPAMDYIVASVDTAMTAKEENDWSACTVWGMWRNEYGLPKIMMMDAWHDRLEFRPLVERIIETCRRNRVDRVLIEGKANGLSVAQEIGRLLRGEEFGGSIVQPKGDKVARAYAVTHMLEARMVYAPDRKWSDLVMDECSVFPKGAHDDLVDTVTQALKHLRDIGVALLPEEREEDLMRRNSVKASRPAALPYAV